METMDKEDFSDLELSDKVDCNASSSSSSTTFKSNNNIRNNKFKAEMLSDDENSPINEFFNDKGIFVTGATGFMGKVLVEKLLRSCIGVKNVYVLLRPKNGQTAQQRLNDMVNGKVFDRIRFDNPIALSKLVPIVGDISAVNMALEDSDLETLVNNVHVVFHSAATVKFDEPMKASVNTNVIGTRRLVELCHKLPHLVSVVHVSTAYCNCDRKEVEEIVYPPPLAPQHIIDTVEWMDQDLLTTITPKLISGRPNTYTFTKALAETLLVEECGSLPVAIVRPSIVTAALREPFPGWVDNLNGMTGLLVAASKGILRSMLITSGIKADFIPVDVVINLMIAVAYHTATQRPNNIMVYNCTSGSVNPITWGQLEVISFPLILKIPSGEVFRYPGGSFKTSKVIHRTCVMLQHYLPAAIVDVGLMVCGRKPKVVNIYKKIHKAVAILEYFTTNEWLFHSGNVTALSQQLTISDRKNFNFSIEDMDWNDYLESYLYGIRKFLLKEEESTLPAARTKLKKLYITGQLTNLAMIAIFWRLLISRSVMARRLWFFIIKLALKFYSSLPLPAIAS